MLINYEENNKVLIEKTLERILKEIFVKLKMGLADWDLDAILRGALEEPSQIDQIQDIVKKYDETFDTAKVSNIQIQDKYKHIYKLVKKEDT